MSRSSKECNFRFNARETVGQQRDDANSFVYHITIRYRDTDFVLPNFEVSAHPLQSSGWAGSFEEGGPGN